MDLKQTYNPFSAYAELPKGVRFRDQGRDEEVVVLLRQHPIVNLRWMVLLVLSVVIPILMVILYELEITGFGWLDAWPESVVNSLVLIWYVGVLGFGLEIFLMWYYSVYLVTNHRVLDNEFKGLLQYSSNGASLRNIQNVVHDQRGVWQLLFNYGDVRIKTAATGSGGSAALTFDRVPQPARVAEVLDELAERSRRDVGARESGEEESKGEAQESDMKSASAVERGSYKVARGGRGRKYGKER